MDKLTVEINDKVIALRDLFEEATGDNPRLIFARKRDVLVIREILPETSAYDFAVSHEGVTDRSFKVESSEIQLKIEPLAMGQRTTWG